MELRKYIFIIVVIFFGQGLFSQELKKPYEKEIYFDFGKDEIKSDQLKTLQIFLRAAKANYSSSIYIYGYTDNIDSKKFNYKLGLKRAHKVKKFLVEKGLDSNLIQIKSEGGIVYKTTNKTEDGRAINRRVLLSIQPVNAHKSTEKKSNYVIVLTDINTKKIIKGNLEIRTTTGGTFAIDSLIRYNVDRTPFLFLPKYFYTMVASADGYMTKDTIFQLIDTNKKEIFIALKPYSIKEKLIFEKIHFKPNLPEFQASASTDLIRLLSFMRNNKETSIQIIGHINYPIYRPSMTAYEEYFFYDLSVKRAKAVKNYLLQNGIEDKRIYFKGLSNKQMIYPEANQMSEYLKNMRVEVMVLK